MAAKEVEEVSVSIIDSDRIDSIHTLIDADWLVCVCFYPLDNRPGKTSSTLDSRQRGDHVYEV